MTALKIIGILLVILWLISLSRVGGTAEYSTEGIVIKVRAWFLRITVYPMQKKGKKPPKEKKQKKTKAKTEEKPPKEKKGGTLGLLLEFIPMAAEAAGKLLHKIHIDEIIMRLTWATPDPAKTAMGYGAANAALGMVWPILDYNFHIKDRDVQIDLDFEATEPVIYVRASLTMTIGQIVSFAVIYSCKALMIYLRHHPPRQKPQCNANSK